MKSGIFDIKSSKPLLPMVHLATHACQYIIKGGACTSYGTEGVHAKLVEAHAKQQHNDDTNAAHSQFCGKVRPRFATAPCVRFRSATAARRRRGARPVEASSLR